jgi:hypothetical protein
VWSNCAMSGSHGYAFHWTAEAVTTKVYARVENQGVIERL